MVSFAGRRFRLNRLLFVCVMILALLSVMWPGYPLFASAEPFILGLPLAFAWIAAWVVISFLAMLGLYLSDHHGGS